MFFGRSYNSTIFFWDLLTFSIIHIKFPLKIKLGLGSSKGQIILKCLFGVFNFLQKMNKNKSTWGFIAVKQNSFIHFLEKTSAWKNNFDFFWPLVISSIDKNIFPHGRSEQFSKQDAVILIYEIAFFKCTKRKILQIVQNHSSKFFHCKCYVEKLRIVVISHIFLCPW